MHVGLHYSIAQSNLFNDQFYYASLVDQSHNIVERK